ncbi:MAG: DUF3822 family protein [Bacteroidales bacterium]|nr:DUF3822 family protein [Candidatus Liminaster caballi]
MTNNVKQISIRLLPDGFSLFGQDCLIAPGADFDQRLEEALIDALTDTEADDTVCSVETTRFCLSPTNIGQDQAESMFHLTMPESDTEETLIHQTSDDLQITATFALSTRTYNFLRRNYGDVTFTHPIIALHNLSVDIADDGNCMIVEADGRWINIAVYKARQLYLANRFQTASTDNALFYVMNVWTQCQLDVLDDRLHFVTAPDELRQTISKYIKQCE